MKAWAVGALGPQNDHRSRSAASPRKMMRVACVLVTCHAPACAPSGSLWSPLPGVALVPLHCWVLPRRRRNQHSSGMPSRMPTGGPQGAYSADSHRPDSSITPAQARYRRAPKGSAPSPITVHIPPSFSAHRLGPFSRDFCFLSLRRWQRWWWWGAGWLAGARSRGVLQR